MILAERREFMCTAATYKTEDFYFGRTLDYEFSYGEEVTITPRHYPFRFLEKGTMDTHYAMIGMAHIEDDCPLYYEAVNEKGLGMAGLNFVGNAVYWKKTEGKDNIASFELISWILGQCATVKQAQDLLENLNLWDAAFSPKLPTAQLHWIISDSTESITVESTKDGLKLYQNSVGVLTNNPTFDKQLFALNNYMYLSNQSLGNRAFPNIELKPYSRGMGALGLPGDLSSQSRFIRASFVKMNSVSGSGEKESVSQFFHILNSVDQQRGCCRLENGEYEISIYTCCCNATKGIYYYTSYNNHQITAIDMHREDLEGSSLIKYAPIAEEQIYMQNKI